VIGDYKFEISNSKFAPQPQHDGLEPVEQFFTAGAVGDLPT
jgi:hypothetical protein